MQVPAPSTVTWIVQTTAFRKIREVTVTVTDRYTISWDLKDKDGEFVANGLYYLQVRISGPKPLTKLLKVMILR